MDGHTDVILGPPNSARTCRDCGKSWREGDVSPRCVPIAAQGQAVTELGNPVVKEPLPIHGAASTYVEDGYRG